MVAFAVLAALALLHPPVRVLRPSRLPAPRADAAAVEESVVTFSDKALSQLQAMRTSQGLDEMHIRMGVRAGGCSGMSYVMDVMSADDITEGDTVLKYDDGIRCVIDPKSLLFLYGLKLDYSDELIGGGFSFHNPNADSTCGCGKSFEV
ncbi:hypothetical protein AB1Y20_011356 [Prymnesium parvum]|uniref:Core domain-containing protein n=1 Tax=Prymnesium parvum TaxID=97485 RepID=A0AB34IPH1_PRYPA